MFKARIKETGEIAEFSTGKNLHGETILLKVGTASFFKPEEVENIDQIGWHPASEVPQINKKVVAITTNGKAQEDVYYDGNRYCWNDLTIKIKWWCYPPQND